MRVPLLDVLVVAMAALMLLTAWPVLFFHMEFVLLAVQAFFLRLRPFVVRALLGVTLTSAEVLFLVQAHRTQPEELIEIPLMATILVTVFAIARRRETAWKQLERHEHDERARLERDAELREEFVSMVVHELRNPLVGIRAAARSLAAGRLDASVAPALASEAESALDLLERLSDMTRVESGSLRDVFTRIDLGGVVRTALQTTDVGVHTVAVHDPGRVFVFGNERRLVQVVRNLVANAAKYSPEGTEIEIDVGYGTESECARVVVRDHGPGIPVGERERLFQKFARLSTAGGTRGSGLGLYIVQAIVEQHGGSIVADWPSGGGTAFAVTIPLATIDERLTRMA